MANTYIRVNWNLIKAKVERAAQNRGRPVARKKAYDLFYRAKRKMLRKFNTHLITLEIEAGPSFQSKNISGTLGGYGNLFSFLGFTRNSKPIELVREVLTQNTTWNGNPTFNSRKQWIFKVFYPTRKEIQEVTNVLPWKGGAPPWLDIIEKGAPNLQFYINLKRPSPGSFSNYGFQLDYEINDDLIFHKDPYITKILENFRDTLNNSSINAQN